MKYLFLITVVAVALWGWTTISAAQEPVVPPPDYGETNLLLLACQYLTDSAKSQSVVIKYCRRAAPDEINGYQAVIHVKLATYLQVYKLDVLFRKSMWNISTAVETP